MEAFKAGLNIEDFGTVYCGLKHDWISLKEVIHYCEGGFISCNQERLERIRDAIQDSLFRFYKLLKEFIEEDGGPPIIWNEDSNYVDFRVIPDKYMEFWEIEILLRILHSDLDKEKKLVEVDLYHSIFNYPSAWLPFIYYMPPPDGKKPVGLDEVYNRLTNYVETKILEYRKRSKIDEKG